MSFEERWGIDLDRAATQLDEQLRVVDNGRIQVSVALCASFYVSGGETSEVREHIADVFARYRQAVGDALVWGGDPRSGRPVKLRDQAWLDLKTVVARLGPDDDFQPTFHGGPHKDDASPHRFVVLSRTQLPTDLSSVTFAVPLSWPVGKPPGAYLQLVLDVCKLLQPAHGYAGLGLALHVTEGGTGGAMRFAAPLALRFRGLQLDFAFSHGPELGEADAIKGADWLTVLSESWVDRLGGRAVLEKQLGPQIPIHDYPGGIVIQAGAHPRFGDVQRAEPMPEYTSVSTALAPIRVAALDSLAPWHSLNRERTAEWLRRFDQ